MNAYQLHRDGDCNPFTCLICAVECDACGRHMDACTCPQLPLDEGRRRVMSDKPCDNQVRAGNRKWPHPDLFAPIKEGTIMRFADPDELDTYTDAPGLDDLVADDHETGEDEA